MRLEDLAVRLVAVEAKLATLTGTSVDTENATSIEELDARLSVVEAQVDHLIAEKTQEHIEDIIFAPADNSPVSIEDVLALSPSADVPQAASIVTDVLTAQVEADSIDHPEVADIVSAAVMAVVTADPDVVTDTAAITKVIMDAVAEVPAPDEQVAPTAAAAVADIIAAVTGEEVASEVHENIAEAIAMPSDETLDKIESRLDVVEAKVDSLLGK